LWGKTLVSALYKTNFAGAACRGGVSWTPHLVFYKTKPTDGIGVGRDSQNELFRGWTPVFAAYNTNPLTRSWRLSTGFAGQESETRRFTKRTICSFYKMKPIGAAGAGGPFTKRTYDNAFASAFADFADQGVRFSDCQRSLEPGTLLL